MGLMRQHFRVVAAMMVREVSTRYGSKPGGYAWALIDPVAHVAIMTLVFEAIARMPALGSSFALFFATGYLPFNFYQAMASYMTGAVKANKSLLNYPVVSPADVVVARYLVQILTSALVSVLVIFCVVALEDVHLHGVEFSRVVAACFLGSLLGLGVALVNLFFNSRGSLYEQVYGIVSRPMFLISGVFFLPDSLPHPFREIILYNPIVHVVMLFRTGFYPEYRAMGMDLQYLGEFTAVMIFLGLALFSLSWRQMREDRL
ncbi:ABC transporter permease [Sinorhizobium meliloti]|uniref:ABC transporter permease n=1 Tax=Rhizobium meliloti TaxID=382 RepID=UPI000FE01FD7|nr:ABC transporter permease [Sinorhizobium meliloti]RVG94217.1 ABC transporter permease [Sinorhizobium meliloti]RVH67256.1 ABC transporter permease [Sinorhizobium meliloti]